MSACISDSSFWHQVEDQQTTSVVSLGHITSNLEDPSVSYWPGPDIAEQQQCLDRAWISHYTSLKFSSHHTNTNLHSWSKQLETIEPQSGTHGNADIGSSNLSKEGNQLLSDILITYKLKNPMQYLRDEFDPRSVLRYALQFDKNTPLYLITGYKVSRDAQLAIEQQESDHEGLKFQLSSQLRIPRAFLKTACSAIPLPLCANFNSEDDHMVLKTVDYQAPGDSIFFVRYQRIIFDRSWQGIMVVPGLPLSWSSWILNGFRYSESTVILAKTLVDGSDDRARVITSRRSTRQIIRELLLADQDLTVRDVVQAIQASTLNIEEAPARTL